MRFQYRERTHRCSCCLKISEQRCSGCGGALQESVFSKTAKVIYTDDEATGSSHMTMTVAGHYNIPYRRS